MADLSSYLVVKKNFSVCLQLFLKHPFCSGQSFVFNPHTAPYPLQLCPLRCGGHVCVVVVVL